MAEGLTDSQIALLCALGEYNELKASDAQKGDLQRLVDGGYVDVVKGNSGSRFRPTATAMEFLGERGAGLNEA